MAPDGPRLKDGYDGYTPTRCGVVAVIGAPNAGKSTLVNQLVGQKVAITSAKAQTTRARMLGIALHELAGVPVQMIRSTPPAFSRPAAGSRPRDGQRRPGRRGSR